MRKNSNQCSKIHIMSEDQACKNSDQLDQHIAFHKAMNATYQFSTRFNQKFQNKNPETNNS